MRAASLAALLFIMTGDKTEAKPLSCDEFIGKLAEQIEKDGNKVYLPTPLQQTKTPAQFSDIWTFTGAFQGRGRLACEKDGRFSQISFVMPFSQNSETPTNVKLQRIVDFASAALCAVEPATLRECHAAARKISQLSAKAFLRSLNAGDPAPHGYIYKKFIKGRLAEEPYDAVEIDYSSEQGEVTISVHGRKGG